MHEELVEQLVLQRHALHGRVRDDVVVRHVVQPRDGVQAAAGLLVAEERHRLRLGALRTRASNAFFKAIPASGLIWRAQKAVSRPSGREVTPPSHLYL